MKYAKNTNSMVEGNAENTAELTISKSTLN